MTERSLAEIAGHKLEVARFAPPTIASAPPIVLLHEGLGSVAAWRGFPEALAAATQRGVIVYSRRGYGGSEVRPPPWPLTFMHDEARRVLPALLDHERLSEAVLVGHSDGASIALLAAGALGARVRAVVTLAPHVVVEDVTVASITRARDAFADPTTRLRERLARHHADVDATFHGWADVWLDPDFRRWDLRGELAHVRAPVLVIQGEDDEYGTLAQVDAVCAGVAGACRRVILPAAGHAPHKDAPEAVLAAIGAFLVTT